MTDDAVQAAAEWMRVVPSNVSTELLARLAAVAVEAARPIIEAEMAGKVVSLAYGQTPDWCDENIEDDLTVPVGDLRAVVDGRYYSEDGYYVRLPPDA